MKAAGGKRMPVPIRDKGHRDGFGFLESDLQTWMMSQDGLTAHLIGDPASDIIKHPDRGAGLMTLERTLQDAISETKEGFEQFDKARKHFRNEIRNEAQSIEAAARKISGEFERVTVALRALQSTYTSGEFCAAVVNAERLAAALSAIQQLQSSKLTFAVIETSAKADDPSR